MPFERGKGRLCAVAHEMLIFGHMKLTFTCGFLALFTAFSAPAADLTSTNSTNSTVMAKTNEVPTEPGDHYTNSIGMELVKVGSFWAGTFDVTQKQYQKVMGSNPSAFGGDSRPVDSVSYQDAVDFCKRLTAEDLEDTTNQLPAG